MLFLFEVLLAVAVGIIAGTFTGISPGVHINLVASLVFSLSAISDISPLLFVVFIVSMSVTHTFIDFIPSVFLGAPDPDTILTVLPGHRLLLRGDGFKAVIFALYGSLFGLITIILISPLLFLVIPYLYLVISGFIPLILILAVLFVISREKSRFVAF